MEDGKTLKQPNRVQQKIIATTLSGLSECSSYTTTDTGVVVITIHPCDYVKYMQQK